MGGYSLSHLIALLFYGLGILGDWGFRGNFLRLGRQNMFDSHFCSFFFGVFNRFFGDPGFLCSPSKFLKHILPRAFKVQSFSPPIKVRFDWVLIIDAWTPFSCKVVGGFLVVASSSSFAALVLTWLSPVWIGFFFNKGPRGGVGETLFPGIKA